MKMAKRIAFNDIKISAIVTTYKGTEAYIEECLNSIGDQIIKPDELIVVVDGYDKPMIYPHTKTIIRDENKGVAVSRDEGVKLSNSEYILFVDGDDVLPENFIFDMKHTIAGTHADIVYPKAILWSKWGDQNTGHENGVFCPPGKITKKMMLMQNYVLVTSCIKRKVYDDIGGFDPDLLLFEDYKFFLEALYKGYSFAYCDTYLKYRQRTQSRNRQHEKDKERIYRKIKKEVQERLTSS
jgi:glycosyltransferase involved in cell wall biosynthesis